MSFPLLAVVSDFTAAESIDRAQGPVLLPGSRNDLTLAHPMSFDEELDALGRPDGVPAQQQQQQQQQQQPSSSSSPSSQPTPTKTPTSSPNPASSSSGAADPLAPGANIRVAIGPQHFTLLKLIGEGAFGKVILVRSRLNHELYAMKAISKKLLRKKNNLTYMKSERDILTKVNHPFIVTLWFAFQTEAR